MSEAASVTERFAQAGAQPYMTDAARLIDGFIRELAGQDGHLIRFTSAENTPEMRARIEEGLETLVSKLDLPQEYADRLEMAFKTGLADGDLTKEEVVQAIATLGEQEFDGIENADAIRDAQALIARFDPEATTLVPGMANAIEILDDLLQATQAVTQEASPAGPSQSQSSDASRVEPSPTGQDSPPAQQPTPMGPRSIP